MAFRSPRMHDLIFALLVLFVLFFISLNFSSSFGLFVGVAIGSCTIVLITVVLLLTFRKRISPIFKNHNTGDGINAEKFIRTYRSELLTNYSYSDIKKITAGFKVKLGEGGYGNVYKGKLVDGRVVAVKLLEKSNNVSHDFVNEVASVGRIHHVNVINLLGFSWNGSKQALIYEYMPNGSLGDLLSNEELCLSLGLARLLAIAIGIAHGIEYLHNGCESRILHLDIKPQNVLLDQSFNPKISDFGLAKVYSRSRSAVTMTGARGTVGYIAPEIFMRNLGNVSHKSDVYSYGMLLLEIVGGRKHVEPNVGTSSEAYFPGWVHDKLLEEKHAELGDSVVKEDTYTARKMVMVGLWCIQINPKHRPSMTRVVEMLSGNVDAIEMPPKPFFSPPCMHTEIDTASVESDACALTLASNSYGM